MRLLGFRVWGRCLCSPGQRFQVSPLWVAIGITPVCPGSSRRYDITASDSMFQAPSVFHPVTGWIRTRQCYLSMCLGPARRIFWPGVGTSVDGNLAVG